MEHNVQICSLEYNKNGVRTALKKHGGCLVGVRKKASAFFTDFSIHLAFFFFFFKLYKRIRTSDVVGDAVVVMPFADSVFVDGCDVCVCVREREREKEEKESVNLELPSSMADLQKPATESNIRLGILRTTYMAK